MIKTDTHQTVVEFTKAEVCSALGSVFSQACVPTGPIERIKTFRVTDNGTLIVGWFTETKADL